jgi:hypothetical protein
MLRIIGCSLLMSAFSFSAFADETILDCASAEEMRPLVQVTVFQRSLRSESKHAEIKIYSYEKGDYDVFKREVLGFEKNEKGLQVAFEDGEVVGTRAKTVDANFVSFNSVLEGHFVDQPKEVYCIPKQ